MSVRKVRVDHDISLLIPEIWCRLTLEERDRGFDQMGHLEPLRDLNMKAKRFWRVGLVIA